MTSMTWKIVRRALAALICVPLLLQARNSSPSDKSSPPGISPQIVLVAESVVQTQWPNTLNLVKAVFGATGQFKPVKTIATALAWRADYENFDKLLKTANHSSTLTPSIVRAVVYTAAGWSLASFQRNDALVADYISYLRVSPDVPQLVKSELAALESNPAFTRAGGQ
jgi:hypothetical protein